MNQVANLRLESETQIALVTKTSEDSMKAQRSQHEKELQEKLLKLADDMDLNFEKEIKELTAQHEKEMQEARASY